MAIGTRVRKVEADRGLAPLDARELAEHLFVHAVEVARAVRIIMIGRRRVVGVARRVDPGGASENAVVVVVVVVIDKSLVQLSATVGLTVQVRTLSR